MRISPLIVIVMFLAACTNYAKPGPLAEGSFGKQPTNAKQVKERVELGTHDEGAIWLEVQTEVGTGAPYGLDKAGPLAPGTPHPFGKVLVQLAENSVATSVTCSLSKPEPDVQNRWSVGLVCEYQAPKHSGEYRYLIGDNGMVEQN